MEIIAQITGLPAMAVFPGSPFRFVYSLANKPYGSSIGDVLPMVSICNIQI